MAMRPSRSTMTRSQTAGLVDPSEMNTTAAPTGRARATWPTACRLVRAEGCRRLVEDEDLRCHAQSPVRSTPEQRHAALLRIGALYQRTRKRDQGLRAPVHVAVPVDPPNREVDCEHDIFPDDNCPTAPPSWRIRRRRPHATARELASAFLAVTLSLPYSFPRNTPPALASVLFPAPFAPTSPTISPARIVSDTLSSARFEPNATVTSSNSTREGTMLSYGSFRVRAAPGAICTDLCKNLIPRRGKSFLSEIRPPFQIT